MTDENDMRVPDAELDYDEELIYVHDGQPFTGVGYEEAPGDGRSEVSYRDGLQDGVARDWYPSGKVKGESLYRDNTLHGASRTFDEHGNVIQEDLYEYGILVSSVRRDSAGELIQSFELDPTDSTFAILEKHRREKGWPL